MSDCKKVNTKTIIHLLDERAKTYGRIYQNIEGDTQPPST
jgi:hypothetical protein